MKNYVIGGLVCLVIALVIGVQPVQKVVNEATNRGTLRGVETCMSYSSRELLSAEALRATCVSAFQKSLYGGEHAAGHAGPRADQRGVSWGGVLENKTPDHVTTWVRVSVSIFDPDGTEQKVFAETPIWIDPLDEAEFLVELPDLEPQQFENMEFCDYEVEEPKSCMGWGVTNAMGVSI
ncbi:hypothetical protein ROLI_010340 [Roseobacter fucihabitans]|uniref:Uncharacterized protein n=1 Tax=Roseobacter fucihabitans TaxID=1537242 RepID=A0ABZ2BPS1_9RHOB|nr:hypothetical protein [Roseobacter litoralis]MBC6965339.1 hypothetical protein [Roseobacter litoralis]MBC6965495.1 hypothetical protein [Roseobacter litoralis]